MNGGMYGGCMLLSLSVWTEVMIFGISRSLGFGICVIGWCISDVWYCMCAADYG